MQQAYLMAVRDKGTPDQWGLINDINTDQDVDDIIRKGCMDVPHLTPKAERYIQKLCWQTVLRF